MAKGRRVYVCEFVGGFLFFVFVFVFVFLRERERLNVCEGGEGERGQGARGRCKCERVKQIIKQSDFFLHPHYFKLLECFQPMMDRNKKDELPKMQVGFIDAICSPIYKVIDLHLQRCVCVGIAYVLPSFRLEVFI